MIGHSDKHGKKRKTHPFLVGMQTCIVTKETSVAVPHEDWKKYNSKFSDTTYAGKFYVNITQGRII